MERTNNHIKPTVSNTNLVTPAPRGSALKSGDTAGNTTQLKMAIGTAAAAQMPRIFARLYWAVVASGARSGVAAWFVILLPSSLVTT
jgi:hypothetical protein